MWDNNLAPQPAGPQILCCSRIQDDYPSVNKPCNAAVQGWNDLPWGLHFPLCCSTCSKCSSQPHQITFLSPACQPVKISYFCLSASLGSGTPWWVTELPEIRGTQPQSPCWVLFWWCECCYKTGSSRMCSTIPLVYITSKQFAFIAERAYSFYFNCALSYK